MTKVSLQKLIALKFIFLFFILFAQSTSIARVPNFTVQGEVAVAKNSDQRLFCFAKSSDNTLWYTVQCSLGGAWNNAWILLGGSVNGSIALGVQPDSTLFVFCKDQNNNVNYIHQSAPGSTQWSSWLSIPETSPLSISSNLVILRLHGKLVLFGKERNSNQLVYTMQKGKNSKASWLDTWAIAGNYATNPPIGNTISGIEKNDSNFALFTSDFYDSSLWCFQNNVTTSWVNIGGKVCGDIGACKNSFGTTEIFAAKGPQDRSLWHTWQMYDGSWHEWQNLTNSNTVFDHLTVGKNADGRMEVFVCGYRGALQHLYQLPNLCWSPLTDFNGSQTIDAFPIKTDSYLSDTNSRLFVIAKSNSGFDNDLVYAYQTVKNGAWSAWNKMNVAFYNNFENIPLGQLPGTWTSVLGGWTVLHPGTHSQELSATGLLENVAIAGDATWTNYSVQAALYFNNDAMGGGCLLGRVLNENTYYELEFRKDDNGVKKWWLWKRYQGQWIPLNSGIFNYNANSYYHLKMDMGMNGTSPGYLVASVSTDNGATFTTLGIAYDSAPLLHGKIGLRSWACPARFDEVLVKIQ